VASTRSRLGVQGKIFAYSVVLVVVLVGSVLLFSYLRASRFAEESLDNALAASRGLYQTFEEERLGKLELVNSVVAESPIFKAVVAETDAATVLDSAREMVEKVRSDFMIVTDSDGFVLAHTDQPDRKGEDFYETPLVQWALEGESVSGVWGEGEKLYHAVAGPLTVGPAILGSVTSGYEINDYLAEDIKKFADCEVVFFAVTGGQLRVVGSTLAENTSSFRDWLADQQVSGEVSDLRLDLGGETYHANLSLLESASGDVEGVFAALRSRDRELAAFRAFQRSVLAVGLLILVLAVVASLVFSRGITRPIKKLVTVTDRIREGDYRSEVVVETDDEVGALARSFRALLGELREKALMEKYISKSAAEMIQRGRTVHSQTVARHPVTVLFSDLRAFTGLATEDRPEQLLASVNQALSQESELVERFGGQVDKFIADRMMAVFRGENMERSAVRCANAILQFVDEGPDRQAAGLLPCIGLSSGDAVSGNVGSADRLDFSFMGRAVHVAARLCDEALPGDILASDEVYQKVKDRVAAEPMAPMRIPGVEAPVSVYLFSKGTIRQSTPTPTGTAKEDQGAATVFSSPSAVGPGTVLGGRYEIQRILGSGGMGMVFQAMDRELDEPVALKLLRPEIISSDPTNLERFKQEIRVARRVTHRNVVRTYDFGDVEGVKFISMEYISGITLKQLIKRRGALPQGVGLRIAKETCSGLAAAHEMGVVHRDVKPQNIILTAASEVKIMDFGIGRTMDTKGLTVTGLVIGTPDYMSPEQAQGKEVDLRSDIYSSGVVFYEIFTGTLPFKGDSQVAVVMKHVQEQPVPPRQLNPDIPPPLEAIIVKCLAKEPAERYQTISELQTDLARLSNPEI
jgi:serine/threonine-protein kinase